MFIVSDIINSIWKSMYSFLAVDKDKHYYTFTEYTDVKYILTTKGITVSKCISKSSIESMKSTLKEFIDSELFPKDVKNIFLNFDIHPDCPKSEVVNIVEMFYEIHSDIGVVFSIITNTSNSDIEYVKLRYFLCGLTTLG